MVSLGHPSLPPTDLGRLDDEETSPVRPVCREWKKRFDGKKENNTGYNSEGKTLNATLKYQHRKNLLNQIKGQQTVDYRELKKF
ncbi:hypothetical protein TNCV_4731501 [Trichonephila clavipes]|nr:hypothetical protein TNCV_4731501 [Trichonephila clavipes]